MICWGGQILAAVEIERFVGQRQRVFSVFIGLVGIAVHVAGDEFSAEAVEH
jgi:hypothetical protein